MTIDFSGRGILVTGASRGIGRAICELFAEAGARIALNYRSDDTAAGETLAHLAGGGHVLVKADVSVPESAKMAVDTAVEALGRLDVVVNNAGIRGHHPPATTEYDRWVSDWNRVLALNLTGAANVSFCAARYMKEHGGGRIVNVSSRGAFRGEPDMPGYGASKAGLNAMSQSMAVALAPYGIFVGVVAPGFVATDGTAEKLAGPEGVVLRAQSPLGRVATAEEVARAVVLLASDGMEFTTGAILDVNGASHLR
jgi:3-oxoacyl-[acyl-carrier protein] reductase